MMVTTTVQTQKTAVVLNLGPVTGVPIGEGRHVQIGATTIAVFRTRLGEVYATQAWCPHRGGPLADGLVGGSTVICPMHSYKFDLATGRAAGNDCPALKTYPVSVDEAGDLLLAFSEEGACQDEAAE